jgi:Flp pilus assembly pilin Flp
MFGRLLIKVLGQEHGASMVEYALLVVLIALVAFVAVQLAGDTLSGTYSGIANDLVDARA